MWCSKQTVMELGKSSSIPCASEHVYSWQRQPGPAAWGSKSKASGGPAPITPRPPIFERPPQPIRLAWPPLPTRPRHGRRNSFQRRNWLCAHFGLVHHPSIASTRNDRANTSERGGILIRGGADGLNYQCSRSPPSPRKCVEMGHPACVSFENTTSTRSHENRL